jgi:hypothetical protein
MRSNNGPEIRFWYFVTTAGAHPQAFCGSLSHPHGQGFIAAINWKLTAETHQKLKRFCRQTILHSFQSDQ